MYMATGSLRVWEEGMRGLYLWEHTPLHKKESTQIRGQVSRRAASQESESTKQTYAKKEERGTKRLGRWSRQRRGSGSGSGRRTRSH